MGSSKVVPLEQDKFYGHLSGLVSLPGKKNPDSPELKFDLWKGKIRKGAVWLPHGKIANAPGHPVWDTTGGKFGVFEGQMFMGDQTMSNLFRVVPERVKGIDQGSVTPFARFFASGVMPQARKFAVSASDHGVDNHRQAPARQDSECSRPSGLGHHRRQVWCVRGPNVHG